MSARNFESFLAHLYVDADLRARFRASPHLEARKAGLDAGELRSLETLDWTSLELAARGFAGKRAGKRKKRGFARARQCLGDLFAVLLRPFRRRA
ncbi:MAG TPA: hypothetical protein VK525_22225 [Candidatus Saccharimonadales bacterium]|nr:hypothetical protein [Candidatus Saccharimonadales bacterium]